MLCAFAPLRAARLGDAPLMTASSSASVTANAGSSDQMLILVGFRRPPNKYSRREHEEPRNQMISVKGRAKLGYMPYQKRQAAKR
jgi:hypothetical protein